MVCVFFFFSVCGFTNVIYNYCQLGCNYTSGTATTTTTTMPTKDVATSSLTAMAAAAAGAQDEPGFSPNNDMGHPDTPPHPQLQVLANE